MKYYFYNRNNQKMKEMTSETFNCPFYLMDYRGLYTLVTMDDVESILDGNPSMFRIKNEKGNFVLFTSKIIEQFLPKTETIDVKERFEKKEITIEHPVTVDNVETVIEHPITIDESVAIEETGIKSEVIEESVVVKSETTETVEEVKTEEPLVESTTTETAEETKPKKIKARKKTTKKTVEE